MKPVTKFLRRVVTKAMQASATGLSLADKIADMDHALTTAELAKLLSVNRATIFRHAKANRIPHFHVCVRLRFDPRATAKWLRAQ
ncbi:MAG TPA: helix-turn-helix domain-containing protein [Terriglobales bacterium]|nr:helix-turn-helix domain-containing protein [Terriglobales bacterium]